MMENQEELKPEGFKSGFISILGKPNVGKSTLMNALVGERLSIITAKPQTTRHRIFGVVSGDGFQMVYSDTPGIIDPNYRLQEGMMRFVKASLQDADIILFVVEPMGEYDEGDFFKKIWHTDSKILLIINKTDLVGKSQLAERVNYWSRRLPGAEIIPVSALRNKNIDILLSAIKAGLPYHPPYFPSDTLTDKPDRFFAGEIIREKIFLNYRKEVPYSCEVVVTEFKEEEDIIRASAAIYVERRSQKGILIGHQGSRLKKAGTEARLDMEKFFNKRVHLETYVKVRKDWRKNDTQLRRFGYLS